MLEPAITISIGHLIAIVGVQIGLVALSTLWRNRHDDAKSEALDAKTEGIGKALDAKIACVQEAVATGAEEHKAWREELDKTNKRLDDEFAKTNKRLDDEFANTNKRLDDLLMHLMSRDK